MAATAVALSRCGIRCLQEGDETIVQGGVPQDPETELNFGNSGTGVRLTAGLLAGSRVHARLNGDASLRRRPMDRIVRPLCAMGADVWAARGGRFLPLVVNPSTLRPLEYALPDPSAQVKSCLLLAGLAGGVAVRLHESTPSRDHTERMLSAMGAAVHWEEGAVTLEPSAPLRPLRMRVPGDFSGAAFFLGLATLLPGARIELPGVGVNPGRTALLEILAGMGADVRVVPREAEGGEPVADLEVGYAGRLRGVDVPPELAPGLIDEVPLLAVLAATAAGRTRIMGVGELRVKESDRLRAITSGLRGLGVKARELADGLEITGSTRAPMGRVDTHEDHRIAMAFAVLGRLPGASVRLSETASIATSFPEFPSFLEELRG